jgi:hypothetical protein
MASGGCASKALAMGISMSPLPHGLAAGGKINDQGGHTARAKSEFGAPDSQPANPIPVCSHGNR